VPRSLGRAGLWLIFRSHGSLNILTVGLITALCGLDTHLYILLYGLNERTLKIKQYEDRDSETWDLYWFILRPCSFSDYTGVPGLKVHISWLNSRSNSESDISHTRGSDLQRLLVNSNWSVEDVRRRVSPHVIVTISVVRHIAECSHFVLRQLYSDK
jgi:hypothetical protein